MTIMVENLITSKSVFFAHKDKCLQCQKMVMHKTSTLSNLCYQGTLLYKALLKAEDDIVKHENAKERAKVNKEIRRRSFIEIS
jgi:hypothetical protein